MNGRQPLPGLDAIRPPDLRADIEARLRRPGPDRIELPQFPPPRRRASTLVVVVCSIGLLIFGGVLLWNSVPHRTGPSTATPSPTQPGTSASLPAVTPCSEILPECTATRLPDLILRNGQTLGALGPVDGFDMQGVLSSDQALRIGGAEAVGMHGKKVRVVLGSADADRLHWGHGTNLYYAIDWGGVCYHGSRPMGSSPDPGCDLTTWSTVIDAHTGAFIVEGNGPDPRASPEG